MVRETCTAPGCALVLFRGCARSGSSTGSTRSPRRLRRTVTRPVAFWRESPSKLLIEFRPMPDAFSMLVPLAAPYRALAPDLASRYAELSGGSAEAAAALASAVNAAIDRVAAGASPHATVGLAFTPES